MARPGAAPLPKIEPTENCQLGNITTDFLANSDNYNVILLEPPALIDQRILATTTTQLKG